jgi:hypothetical protein
LITASGAAYQEAAAWAAATFAANASKQQRVSVLVPAKEPLTKLLSSQARKFGFDIARFSFRQISDEKYTSQLKCQAYAAAVSQLKDDDLVLFADADTCCLREITLPVRVLRAVLPGNVGMVRDIADRHFRSPQAPWYLAPAHRLIYVNSGVILASGRSLELFRKFLELSQRPEFLCGPFNDQKVINYALGMHFRERLVLMQRKHNWIGPPFAPSTVVAHYAGGAGWLGQQRRKAEHQAHCAEVIKSGAAARSSESLRAAARSSQPPAAAPGEFSNRRCQTHK